MCACVWVCVLVCVWVCGCVCVGVSVGVPYLFNKSLSDEHVGSFQFSWSGCNGIVNTLHLLFVTASLEVSFRSGAATAVGRNAFWKAVPASVPAHNLSSAFFATLTGEKTYHRFNLRGLW